MDAVKKAFIRLFSRAAVNPEMFTPLRAKLSSRNAARETTSNDWPSRKRPLATGWELKRARPLAVETQHVVQCHGNARDR